MAFSLKKIKPIHILLVGIVIVFVYMTFFNSNSSSKFGAAGDLVIPQGVTSITITFNVIGIATPVTATLSLLGVTNPTSIQITAYNAGTGTNPVISWSVNGISNTSQNVQDAPVTGVTIPNKQPNPGSALTQCIGQNEHQSYGYASQQAMANAACAAVGLGTATIDDSCGTDGHQYLCSEQTGNVSITVPAFALSTVLTYTEYGPSGAVENTETIQTSAYGSTYSPKADTLPFAGGTIAIKVKTSGNPTDITYYWIINTPSGTPPATPVTTGLSQGTKSFSKENPPKLSISIPSNTVTLTAGVGAGAITNIKIV